MAVNNKPISLYNTKSRTKELFLSRTPGKVSMYSCGPTVYSTQHVGNMRAAFIVDLLRRVLIEVGGYEVNHIMNITDVGHLTGDNEGDANQGEDRMEKGARKEGTTAREVAKKYTQLYIDDMQTLSIPVTTDMAADGSAYIRMPRATDHIAEQIHMVEQLEAGGHTYIIPNDGVYMDTTTMENYGELLSEKHLEGIQEGARIQADGKRNPTDFALWKFNITGKKRDMERESPWGVGFPGWHIECSAMSVAYLGTAIDIHTGGMEHIPIHHTNEIAQAECSCSEYPWVNYWLHYQWLMMNGTKISKSLGNVTYVQEILDKGFIGEDIRYFFLQAHYRSFQDFTRESMEAAKKAREKLIHKAVKLFETKEGLDKALTFHQPGELYDQLCEKLADDLHATGVLSSLHEHVGKDIASVCDMLVIDSILGLRLYEGVVSVLSENNTKIDIPGEIIELANQRVQAKNNKDYALSDELREKISSAGRSVKDTSDGYEITKK